MIVIEKKLKLSGIDTSIRFMITKDLFPSKNLETPKLNKDITLIFFKSVINLGRQNSINCQLGKHNYNLNTISKLSLHRLILDFKSKEQSK